MKFFTLPALLAAALFSAVVVIPFLPAAKTQTALFALEASMTSTSPGVVVLYYDSGSGFSESAVTRVNLTKSDTPLTYRLALPPGTYRSFRFDPIDREAGLSIASLRVTGLGGRVIRPIALSELKPAHQIQALRPHGDRLDVVVEPGTNDPQLVIDFAPPLVISPQFGDLTSGFWVRAFLVFLPLAGLLFAVDRSSRLRTTPVAWARTLSTRPGRAIALAAAVAVVLSAYPVVFLGQSYVSPNLGTALLYDAYPTLPGYTSGEVVDVKGSDVGAIMWQHVPFSMIQHRALAQGELPLWNRYNASGVPLLAQGQSMFGDPLHLFVILANGASWAWDLKYLIAKWLFATALGLLVLALTRPTLSSPQATAPPASLVPALVVAFIAPFVGFFLYRLNHPAFFSLCYAPWALYCWVRITQAPTRRTAALWITGLIVANAALMNSGTAKEAYMLLLCMNFSGLCVLATSGRPLRERVLKAAALAWAGVIFVLLVAPIWLTFVTTLKTAYTSYNAASAFQVQPSLLLGAFDELFYRPLMAEQRTFNPSVNFAVLLGLLYFLATFRHHFSNRLVLALAASSLLPLSLAFGLIPWAWIVKVPFLSNVAHLDNTFSCVLIVLWCVLAGVGFAAAARRLGTAEGRGDLVSVSLMLFALVFAWIGFRQAVHRSVFGVGATFTTLKDAEVIPVNPFIWGELIAFLLASVVLALVLQRAFARRSLTPAGAILLVLCSAVLLWRTALHTSSVGFDDYTARPTTRVNFQARSEAIEFLRTAQTREPSRGYGLHGNFFPGWTGAYGLETIHGPDALINPFLREVITSFTTTSAVERWWDWRIVVDIPQVAAARPLLDALNVRYYLDLPAENRVLKQSLTLVKSADLDVFESPTAWPRAFFTDHIDAYERADEFTQKIRTGDGRPFALALRNDISSQPALLAIPRGLAGRTVTPASDYKLTENTTSFTLHAKSAGVVVLTEVLWPGDFRAEINGKKAAVLRLNHAFKGVALDGPGDYRITFRYVPKNWPRNLLLCALGVVLLALSLAWALRRPRAA
jgi:hypothetical protein